MYLKFAVKGIVSICIKKTKYIIMYCKQSSSIRNMLDFFMHASACCCFHFLVRNIFSTEIFSHPHLTQWSTVIDSQNLLRCIFVRSRISVFKIIATFISFELHLVIFAACHGAFTHRLPVTVGETFFQQCSEEIKISDLVLSLNV